MSDSKRTVIVVEPRKAPRTVVVEGLADLQDLVGGYIEAAPVSDDFIVWVNEEGKLMGLEPCLDWPEAGDVLCGPVVFAGVPDDEGNSLALSDAAMASVLEYIENNKL